MPSRLHFSPGDGESSLFPSHRWNIHFNIPIKDEDAPPPGQFFEAFNDGMGNFGDILYSDGINSGKILVAENPAMAMQTKQDAGKLLQLINHEMYHFMSIPQKLVYQVKRPLIAIARRLRR